MQWILFTLLNVFANGSVIFLIKSAIKNTKLGYSGVVFISLLFACIFYLPLFVINFLLNPVISTSPEGYYLLLFSILMTVINYYIYIRAISINDLSVFGPLDSARPFFVFLFSMIFLGQLPTKFVVVGTCLIFLGALVLTFSKKFFTETGDHKRVLLVLLSTAIMAFTSIIDKKTMYYITPINYVFFIMLSVCLVNGAFYLSKTKKIDLKFYFSPMLIIMGILWVLGNLGIMLAVKISSPNQVVPLQMTRSLYISFLGFVLLKEKGYFKKITAALIMLLGVYFIVR